LEKQKMEMQERFNVKMLELSTKNKELKRRMVKWTVI
jgi:hypothetical protein